MLLAVGACAAPTPVTLNQTFIEPTPRPPAKGVPAKGCAITFTEVVDARRAPDTLGLVGGKAVKSPDDPQAWIRSVLSGLGSRGFTVAFGDDPAAPPPVITGRVSLQTAWVSSVRANKTATVVLRFDGKGPGDQVIGRNFRGDLANINWAGSDDELQELVDRTMGEALDVMAADLRPYCPG